MATETIIPDQIQNILSDLETKKTLITNCTLQWKTLAHHFASLEKTLGDCCQSLDSKIQALDSQTQKTVETLDLREASIPDRGSAASALIEDRKGSIISEMEDPDAKIPEDLRGILRWLCRRMDSGGLWRFMVSRRKDLSFLRREISDAVAGSVDPARLVLDALEDSFSQNEIMGGWALGMLIRSLFDSEGRTAPDVSDSIRERAAVVAEAWRKKYEGKGEGKGGGKNGPEERMFLQMVVAFGLSKKFEEEFLKKLVLEHVSRKEIAKLAAGLGFGEKLTDIIDELVQIGKEVEAIYFAYESGLSEKISPASLLKSYLQRSKKNTTAILKSGNRSIAATEESSNVELNAIQSIIKCVETHNLEPKFSLGGLRKRLAQLEKAKADRKKMAAAANKSQSKRARSAGSSRSSTFRPSKAVRTSNAPYATYHWNQPAAAHQIPPAHHPYNYPIQGGGGGGGSSGYDGLTPSYSYGAAHTQNPATATIPQQYYMPEDMGVPRNNSVPYAGTLVANYGGYDYAAAAAPPPQTAPALPHYPHQH